MTPEFYYDAEREHVMFCCPHQSAFTSLPTCIWRVESIEPLTVSPSIRNTSCGCHGFIRDGVWVAV